MILIVYGEEKKIFASKCYDVQDAINELYQFVKGGLDDDIFSKAITGMAKTVVVADMVQFFNELAYETPIHTIYTQAKEYWSYGEAN